MKKLTALLLSLILSLSLTVPCFAVSRSVDATADYVVGISIGDEDDGGISAPPNDSNVTDF